MELFEFPHSSDLLAVLHRRRELCTEDLRLPNALEIAIQETAAIHLAFAQPLYPSNSHVYHN